MQVKNEPNPIALLLTIGWTIFVSYIAYRAWFDTPRFREEYKKGLKGYPSWYPFRNHGLDWLAKDSWVWQIRLISSLGTVIGIVVTATLIAGLFG